MMRAALQALPLGRLRTGVRAIRRRLAPRPDEAEQRVLFLFCGDSSHWLDAGRRLYRSEPRFREGIDAADALVREIAGVSPAAALASDDGGEDVCRDLVVMTLTQIGIADLWHASQPVEPGFLGLGGGEVGAAYAAGALSREQAIRTICAIAASLETQRERTHFTIDAHAQHARALCRAAPRPLDFDGEVIAGISQLRCNAEDAEANRAFLAARVPIRSETDADACSVRTMGLDEARFAVDRTAAGTRRAPLYLCSFGGRVPDATALGAAHWAWMANGPCRMANASAAACADGFNHLIAGSEGAGARHAETAGRFGMPCRAIPIPAGDTPWTGVQNQLDRRRLVPARPPAPQPAIALEAHLADPDAAYAALRRDGPVHFVPTQGFWIVLGHAETRAVCADPASYSSQPYAEVDAVLIGRDPPGHAAVRRVVARQFDPATVRRLERFAAARAEALLRPRLDVVGDYAAPFSRSVAAELIGLDADGLAAIEAADDGESQLSALIAALDGIADRTAAYARIRAAEPCMPEAEVRSLVRFLWLAAITTTERAIARAAFYLVDRPDLLAALRADRKRIAPFVEEVLRLHPPEQMIPRRTTRATQLAGVDIPAGAEVQLCIAAANRDPAVFDDPAEFRLDRAAGHLSFGSGIHHCSGTALARRLIPIAMAALVDAPGLRAIQPLATIEWFESVRARVPTGLVIGT